MPHILRFVPRSLLPRARNNMAMRMLPGNIPEFDTVEEMITYQRAMGQTGPSAAAPPRAAPSRATPTASAETRAAAMALLSAYGAAVPSVVGHGRAGKAGKAGGGGKPLCTAATLSVPTLAKAVGAAMGGMNIYCRPGRQLVLTDAEKVALKAYTSMTSTSLQELANSGDAGAERVLATRLSHLVPLNEVGIDPTKIKPLADALRAEGLLVSKCFTKGEGSGETLAPVNTDWGVQKDPGLIRKAHEVARNFGYTGPMRSNPRSRSNPRRW